MKKIIVGKETLHKSESPAEVYSTQDKELAPHFGKNIKYFHTKLMYRDKES